MTTPVPLRCNRCHRVLRQPPICGYGPKCAARYGLTPERRVRVRAPTRTGTGEPVLDGLEALMNDEINESEEA